MLRANAEDKERREIQIGSETVLRRVPADAQDAWRYRLGSRSALEWVLDQYKEKKPRDPTIRERFNTYRFADYKEDVIDLLRRVCTVSVRTAEIVGGWRGIRCGEGLRRVPGDSSWLTVRPGTGAPIAAVRVPAVGQVSPGDTHGANVKGSGVFRAAHMDVRSRVIVPVHVDDYAEESANLRQWVGLLALP